VGGDLGAKRTIRPRQIRVKVKQHKVKQGRRRLDVAASDLAEAGSGQGAAGRDFKTLKPTLLNNSSKIRGRRSPTPQQDLAGLIRTAPTRTRHSS
jgi:hypothetical protein